MATKDLAIATCRVSSNEQLLNNSLSRQKQAVIQAAKDLDVTILEDGWWSGSVSSKKSTNVYRKDLREMLARCKKDKRIRYLIVDVPDRFMRSIDEAAYFEVSFRLLGVTVWYTSDPELNKGDLSSKLVKFTKYLSAEGSNDDRVRQSIDGQTVALKLGRYPFPVKPGYKRGYERGVHEVDEAQGSIMNAILVSIATKRVTPSKGLIEFNKTIRHGRSPYKMDKFRNIVTDPYYAGIVEIDKQVKVRNENGVHEPLITKAQHQVILEIMSLKAKNQSGPHKNGNPKYPCSNLVTCTDCIGRKNCRIVGFDHGNGKPGSTLIYEKYRCRSCGKYIARQELHDKVAQQFKEHPITQEGLVQFQRALDIVWKQQEEQVEQDATRLKHTVKILNEAIERQVDALTDPANATIQPTIREAISKKEAEAERIRDELTKLLGKAETDKAQFLAFAFDFIENMGSKFLTISDENRKRCKELMFPAGFFMDANKKVYTPEVSPLTRLMAKKKDTEVSNNSLMVRVRGL